MSLSSTFVHLRVHTAYSLLEGAIKIKELVKLCKEQQMPAVAITDRDNLFGSMEFSAACAEAGIQPIIGCQMSLAPMFSEQGTQHRRDPDQLLLLAKDEAGYANLLALASETYLAPADGQGPLLSYETLARHAEGLIALSAGKYGALGKAVLGGQQEHATRALQVLKDLFVDRLYIELMRHGTAEERQIEKPMIELALEEKIPLVATNDIYFHGGREMYEAHDALLCIAEGRYVSEENRRRLTPEHRFRTPQEMRLLFADIPEAIENTLVIAERCAVMARERKPMLPGFKIMRYGVELSENEALMEKAREGLEKRLQAHVFTDAMSEAEKETAAKPYHDRLEFELNVITQMEYSGYFLIVSDFIIWAKEHGIPVGPGRGSGAASVVAWSLLITDLDPLKYGLVFERFLNPERISMPDFDIDFCQERRDEVIRYVQGKYGHDKVAQIITFGTLQARAVLRDVGRVLQMPYGQVDKICKLVPHNPASPVSLEEAIEIEPALKRQMEEEESVRKLIEVALKLEGLYRHASTHAAGVVIADRPLSELAPLYRDPRSDMPVVQYSMKYAEAAGLVKFDFLGLKTLTVLAKAVELIGHRGIAIDLLRIPLDDQKTYDLLSRGEAIGIFQFESAGMRDALKKLKPDCLEDLIALGALYRPGPMDNIPKYIACKHGREKADYLHPSLEPVLRETHGVIIYQEQVQQIAQILAGYTLGGADILRRAMGKKIQSEMNAQRQRFVDGAKQNGIDPAQSHYIFDLVAKFAGYGFNKAHAAAYALIGYQTAYLKANYPVEFIAASMTYDMHNTDKLAVFKEDAERLGIALLPPDVNRSGAEFSVEASSPLEGGRASAASRGGYQKLTPPASDFAYGSSSAAPPQGGGCLAIRYALGAIKGVGAEAMRALVAEREKNGAFKDVFDLLERLDAHTINRRQFESLIKAGAFDSLHANRKQLFESLDMLVGYNQSVTRERESNQISLFGEAAGPQVRPALVKCSDWSPLERLACERDAVGFYLSSHPLEGYRAALAALRVTPAANIADKIGIGEYRAITLAGVVTGHKIRVSDRGRFAFVELSDTTGAFEVAIFDETVLNTYRHLLENGTLALIQAEGKQEDAGARLIVRAIKPLQDAAKSAPAEDILLRIAPPLRGSSRDAEGVEAWGVTPSGDSKAPEGEPLPARRDAARPPSPKGRTEGETGEALAPTLATLKHLLGIAQPKGAKVILHIPIAQNKTACLELAGRYIVPPETLQQMRQLAGVEAA